MVNIVGWAWDELGEREYKKANCHFQSGEKIFAKF